MVNFWGESGANNNLGTINFLKCLLDGNIAVYAYSTL